MKALIILILLVSCGKEEGSIGKTLTCHSNYAEYICYGEDITCKGFKHDNKMTCTYELGEE